MAITLITGSPGSGKTLYTVDKLLPELIAREYKVPGDDAGERKVKTTIYSNITGLVLEHERMDAAMLDSWPDWARPGDVIVFDEFQRVWPAAPSGQKVSPGIQGLETHRHRGVDFILITQHPRLIHTNVRSLISRHLHFRRLGKTKSASVYEWDLCSAGLQFSKTVRKFIYRYSKKSFQNYISSELHTKPMGSLPFLFWVVLFALVGSSFAAYRFYHKFLAAQEVNVVREAEDEQNRRLIDDIAKSERLNAIKLEIIKPKMTVEDVLKEELDSVYRRSHSPFGRDVQKTGSADVVNNDWCIKSWHPFRCDCAPDMPVDEVLKRCTPFIDDYLRP